MTNDKEAGPAPAPTLSAYLGDQDSICGSEPPRDGTWGDCWCTLPPDHPEEQLCVCEPCAERYGAPGWRAER